MEAFSKLILVNICLKEVFNEAMGERHEGLTINNVSISNNWYTADSTQCAQYVELLQILTDRVVELDWNVQKTKNMFISKNNNTSNFYAYGKKLQRLGCQLYQDSDHYTNKVVVRGSKIHIHSNVYFV